MKPITDLFLLQMDCNSSNYAHQRPQALPLYQRAEEGTGHTNTHEDNSIHTESRNKQIHRGRE